jgi:hypothetical protein
MNMDSNTIILIIDGVMSLMTITPSSLNLDSAWSGNGWPSSRPYITIFNNDLRFDCRLELCVCDVFSLPKATVFTDAADAVVVKYTLRVQQVQVYTTAVYRSVYSCAAH